MQRLMANLCTTRLFFLQVELLLKFHADVDKEYSKTGCAAIHIAADKGHPIIIEQLIAAGNTQGTIMFHLFLSHNLISIRRGESEPEGLNRGHDASASCLKYRSS